MATASSSAASVQVEIDLPEEFKTRARKQVEVKLRPLVDDAKKERDAKLASAKDDQERKQVEFDYEQQIQSVRAIAEDYYKDTLIAERKRRIGRLNPQVEVSVEQQQAILDAIKGGSGDSVQESQQATAASGAWNAADRNGHSVSDAVNFGERRYAYNDLPAVSTSLEDSSMGPYASQDPPAVSRKVSSGSISSMRSRTDGSRPAASPLDGPSGSRAYGYALSGSPGPAARRDSASSTGLRNAMNPSSSYNPSFPASNLTRRDSNVSVASSRSGGGPAYPSYARRESRSSPMVETARSPSQMSYSPVHVPSSATAVTSSPAASAPPPPVIPSPPTAPPAPPPPPAPPLPPVPVNRSDFRSGISSSAPRSRSPLGLGKWRSLDDTDFASGDSRNVREEPRQWNPYPRGKDVGSFYAFRNTGVRHTSSSSDIRTDSRPAMTPSPMPVTSPDSEFPPSPENYSFRPGSRASNSTDGERRSGVPIPGKSRRALHAPQGSPEFARTMGGPPLRRRPYDVLESTRYASRSPETTRMPYGSVPPPMAIARRNSAGSHRSVRSSRSQSSRPIHDERMRPGLEMEVYEEQLSPATSFGEIPDGFAEIFSLDDEYGEDIEETEDNAERLRLWQETLDSRENDVIRDEAEIKQKLADMERRLAEIEQKAEDSNRLENLIKRKEEETRRREDETKRKEDAVNRRENELRAREQEVRERENDVRKWEEDARRREEDARQRELDARGKEEDAKKREFDARKREDDVRARLEEARVKAEEARQGMEALREKEDELGSAEEDLQRREEELERKEEELERKEEELQGKEEELRGKEAELHELGIVLDHQRQEIQRQLQDWRATQSTAQADRNAFEERQRAEEAAKAQRARDEAERRHAAAIAKEEAVKAREEELRKREQELAQQAQRQKEEERRTVEALGRIAEQERKRPEDIVLEQQRRFEELRAQRDAEERTQAAAEEAQREEQQRKAMLAEYERQARAKIVAEEEARQKAAELAEKRRQEAKAADAERREQEAQRQAEERRRHNSGGGTNPDTARSGTPHSTSAWPNNRNSTASTASSATSSSWSSSAGSAWSNWSNRSNGTSTTNASGASRSSASTPSTARPTGGGWKVPSGAASSTTDSSPRKATADEDVRAWQERQEEHARRQAEQFKKEQERLEKERQTKAAGKMMTKQEYLRLVDDHERQWSQLQVAASISWDSIPWPMLRKPHTPEEITTGAIAGYVLNTYSSGERSDKERLKEHLRRWHPDRFETKLLPKVSSSDRDRVQEGAGHVIRSLNDLSTRSS